MVRHMPVAASPKKTNTISHQHIHVDLYVRAASSTRAVRARGFERNLKLYFLEQNWNRNLSGLTRLSRFNINVRRRQDGWQKHQNAIWEFQFFLSSLFF